MKKKRGKEIVIKLSNRWLYILVIIGILLIVGVGVFAYGTSDPATFGHSADEIDLSEGIGGNLIINGDSIQITGAAVRSDSSCESSEYGTIRKCYWSGGWSSLCTCRRDSSGYWNWQELTNE